MADISAKLAKIETLGETGYQLRPVHYIEEAFRIFAKKPWYFILFALLHIACALFSRFFGHKPAAVVVAAIFTAPLPLGYYIVARKINYDESYSFSNFFDGYNRLGPILVMHICSMLIVIIGFFMLVLPGIYAAVAFGLADCFIWFLYDKRIYQNLDRSRKLISREWFSFLGFMLLKFLVGISGILFVGIGLLVTLPVSFIATYVCFEDIVGTADEDEAEQITAVGENIEQQGEEPLA